MTLVLLTDKHTQIFADWRKNFKAGEKYRYFHHFFPHPEERRRASLLQPKSIMAYALALLAFLAVMRVTPHVAPGVLGYASNISISDLLNLTNKQREKAGLNDLAMSDALSRAADAKARDMFKKDYWAHVAPDGTQPWDFILKQNYDYAYAGENLAKNFGDSSQVAEAWFESPSHRDNLLNKNYTEVGFAVVNGVLDGYETTLVVQMFGKPRTAAYTASIQKSLTSLDSENSKAVRGESVGQAPKEVQPPERITAQSPQLTPIRQVSDVVSSFPVIDVTMATKSINIVLGGFVVGLLGLDVWYSKRRGIVKFTGHTLAHLTLLLLVFAGVWFSLMPGKIL